MKKLLSKTLSNSYSPDSPNDPTLFRIAFIRDELSASHFK